jgi:hypothetical protein
MGKAPSNAVGARMHLYDLNSWNKKPHFVTTLVRILKKGSFRNVNCKVK